MNPSYLIVAIGLIASPFKAHASATEGLITQCGIDQQIKRMSQMAQDQFKPGSPQSQMPNAEELKKAYSQAFEEKDVRSRLDVQLQAKLKSGDIPEVQKWCKTPTHSKIQQSLQKLTQAEVQAQIPEFKAGLAKSPVAPERKKLVEAINQDSGTEEAALEMMTSVSQGAMLGVDGPQAAAMQGFFKGMQSNLRSQMKPEILTSSLFAFKDIPTDDLKKYSTFLKSPAGKNFYQAITQVMVDTTKKASKIAAESIKKSEE